MPLPKNRSSAVRRIPKRTPRGGQTVHYKRPDKGKSHTDPISGAPLQATDSGRGIPKSSRRPNRKFGGTLSSASSSLVIALAARIREGRMSLQDVEVRMQSYVRMLLAKKS